MRRLGLGILLNLLACVPALADGGFVGAQRCVPCHEAEYRAWQGSDHDRAMLEAAREGAVLGDFSGARFESGGISADFFRRDDGYFVSLREVDGTRRELEVVHTFGTRPLQQYLVAGKNGALQALTLAWDSRPAEEGGQRWFSLQAEGEVPPGDLLHWDGPAFRWNRMCADCHSTGLRRGLNERSGGYATVFEEINVACEACHGPAQAHLEWADAPAQERAADPGFALELKGSGAWHRASGAKIASLVQPKKIDGTPEIEVCAPCHARRSAIGDPLKAHGRFLDAWTPEFLRDGLYFADGQIRDEVYVWGSFLQSRMHAAGVTCSDCHDPHSLELHAEGNALCGSCHASPEYDSVEHHFHEPGSPGAQCISCHMPARTYMGVDPRRDHGFRVPRADLALELGVPLPCLDCHSDRDAAWAAAILDARGADPRRGPSFPRVFAEARAGSPGSAARLAGLVASPDEPGIARATALALLGAFPGPELEATAARGARDRDALVRLAAAGVLESLPPAARLRIGLPLLGDATRSVRIEAARALADVPVARLDEGDRAAWEASLQEYRAAQVRNADWPEAHLNLGLLAARQGDLASAREHYEKAVAVGPDFIPAYANLADALRALGAEDRAEAVLRAGLARHPGSADLRHALGLALVRQKRTGEALVELGAAAAAAPGNPRFQWVHAIALNSSGDATGARKAVAAGLELHARDAALLELALSLSLASGDRQAASAYLERLVLAQPTNPRWQQLRHQLAAGAEATGDR